MDNVDEDRFCYYPFMQVLLQPTGVVSPCCWNQDIVYGVIPQQTISEVWNSKVAQNLRQEFLDGSPKTCSQQMRHIGCHRWSRRNFSKNLELTSVQSAGPIRLDVRLNGRCNLQCIMCDVWKQPNGLYNGSDFWTLGPNEIFPFLQEMDVLGGEPFVQSDTYRLIDEISAVNSKCTWAFVTNGNYRFSEAIRSRLDKIPLRWIQISVDSLDEKTYAEIRVRGELTKTLSTLEHLRQYAKWRTFEGRGFRLLASLCVQKLNWREIVKFLDFCVGKQIEPVLQFAYGPAEISVLNLPPSQLEEIYAFLASAIERCGDTRLNSVFLPIREFLHR